MDAESLRLRNPHAILAALAARPHDVLQVLTPPGGGGETWRRVAEAARQAGVPVAGASPEPRQRLAPGGKPDKDGRQGGGEAEVRPRQPVSLRQLFARADGAAAPAGGGATPATTGRDTAGATAGGRYGVWLALDQLQDPHNVGSLFRSAAFFGVRGVLLTSDRAAPVAAVVHDTASGGVEQVPFAVEVNLARGLKQAKDAGLWVLGSAESHERAVPLGELPRDRDWLLVVGNEESGLRRLTLETCDDVCRIPAPGGDARLGSLNAAVAAAVMLAHLSGASCPAPRG